MDIGSKIKALRMAHGLTQTELAKESGLSLPNIQKLEAQKGNPSLQTLAALLKVFGCEIEIRRKPVDWDKLADLGVPIEQKHSTGIQCSKDNLIFHLRLACDELLNENNKPTIIRKQKAIQATLIALQSHYPVLFRKNIAQSALFQHFIPKTLDGNHIKLRRIALANLSKYL